MATNKYTIQLPVEIFDWDETLTYEQISTTIGVVIGFLESTQQGIEFFSEHDSEVILGWLSRNSLDMFLDARDASERLMAVEEEKKTFAKSIMSMKYRKPMSH